MNYRNGETREIKNAERKMVSFSSAFYLEYFSRVLIGGVVDIAEVY